MAKAKSRHDLMVYDFEAREDERTGSNKKSFHVKDLLPVSPKTFTQETFLRAILETNVFGYGSAGTGKSFLAMHAAFKLVLDEDTPYDKLVIIRSTVPVREKGFLPGTDEQKNEPYEIAYKAICDELFPYSKSYENLKKGGYLTFSDTNLRGLTLSNCVMLVDETQNMTFEELDTIITRAGTNTKVVFIGDTKQTDLTKKHDKSGMVDFMHIMENLKEVEMIQFLPSDCVRSGLVKAYLKRKEEIGL